MPDMTDCVRKMPDVVFALATTFKTPPNIGSLVLQSAPSHAQSMFAFQVDKARISIMTRELVAFLCMSIASEHKGNTACTSPVYLRSWIEMRWEPQTIAMISYSELQTLLEDNSLPLTPLLFDVVLETTLLYPCMCKHFQGHLLGHVHTFQPRAKA